MGSPLIVSVEYSWQRVLTLSSPVCVACVSRAVPAFHGDPSNRCVLLWVERGGFPLTPTIPFQYTSALVPVPPVVVTDPADSTPRALAGQDVDTTDDVDRDEHSSRSGSESPSTRRSKIRIVERLESTLGVLDDLALTNLSDEALEVQTEVILERMITQLVQAALEESTVVSEVRARATVCHRVAR